MHNEDILNAFQKHFCSSGEKSEKRVYIDTNKQVYYRLVANGGVYFLEFWIDTYATRRDALQKEMVKRFSAPDAMREFRLFSYYSAQGVGCRRPATTLDELKTDLNAMGELLEPIEEALRKADNPQKESPPVGIGEISVPDLLARKLDIPAYQRAYCWEKENIVGLLEDIAQWQKRHGKEKKHRIGTVILLSWTHIISLICGRVGN